MQSNTYQSFFMFCASWPLLFFSNQDKDNFLPTHPYPLTMFINCPMLKSSANLRAVLMSSGEPHVPGT